MRRVQQPLSPLERLPRDVLTKILAVVGEGSKEDLQNCMLTCEELTECANESTVYQKIELRNLVSTPLLAVNNYSELMKKCLLHSNPSAHYVNGVLEYFHYNNPTEGLVNLSRAADANPPIQEAVYLYGVINLCLGQIEVGKHYLDMLRSGTDSSLGDKCWSNIKRALHGIGVPMRDEYNEALSMMMPPYVCNLNDMDNTCEMCYHYKQMVKFVYTF